MRIQSAIAIDRRTSKFEVSSAHAATRRRRCDGRCQKRNAPRQPLQILHRSLAQQDACRPCCLWLCYLCLCGRSTATSKRKVGSNAIEQGTERLDWLQRRRTHPPRSTRRPVQRRLARHRTHSTTQTITWNSRPVRGEHIHTHVQQPFNYSSCGRRCARLQPPHAAVALNRHRHRHRPDRHRCRHRHRRLQQLGRACGSKHRRR